MNLLFLWLLFPSSVPIDVQVKKVPNGLSANDGHANQNELNELADQLRLKILDSEALFTVTGGMKPISEGFWRTSFPGEKESTSEIDRVRTVLSTVFPSRSELVAGVHIFARQHGGKKSATAFVIHRGSLRRKIERDPSFFNSLGITEATPAIQLMSLVDEAPKSARWRAFGLLFGYPEYAVDFFVAAGESQRKTGIFVERNFISIPTFSADRGQFVYAVPKGHNENEVDRSLKAQAALILAEYRLQREFYIGPGKQGSYALFQNWLNANATEGNPNNAPPSPSFAHSAPPDFRLQNRRLRRPISNWLAGHHLRCFQQRNLFRAFR